MTLIGSKPMSGKAVVVAAKGPRAVLPPNENDCMVQKAFSKPRPPTAAPPASSAKPTRTGRWTQEEKLLFLYGLKRFGRGRWKKIGTLLPTRSLIQIKSHAQKVMKRYEGGENVFAALDENRDYFDFLVRPHVAAQHGAMRKSVMPAPYNKKSKSRKPFLSSSSALNKRPKHASTAMIAPPNRGAAPSPNTLARKSVFQATLGNGNLSFSFKARKPSSLKRVAFKEETSYTPPGTPPPAVHGFADSPSRGGGAAIAAAALCQLSTLGRSNSSEQTVVVSP